MEPDLVQRNVVVDAVCISDEESTAEVDEPPEPMNQQTPRPTSLLTTGLSATSKTFTKTPPPVFQRKESLLTQALHLSEVESPSEEEPPLQSSRDSSSSDADFTSSGTRNNSPSPPLPAASFRGFAPVFSKPDFNQTQVAIQVDDDHLDPRHKLGTEPNVEANLGRKRCITFACGRKASPTTNPPSPPKAAEQPATVKRCTIRFACPSKVSDQPLTKAQTPPKEERPTPAKRCSIRFACPSKVSSEKPSQEKKPKTVRPASPAPAFLKKLESSRAHRDSDSTVRDDSPRSIPRSTATSAARKQSTLSDLERYEATRFHAFASSEEEADDWTQESTCHRSRLTVSDTLKVENSLRKLGEEAEEEAIEEEEAALEDDDDDNDDEDLDDDDDDEDEDAIEEIDESSDDGFKTDNEAGFASSDEDSDADSEYNWWAPGAGASTAATSADHIDPFRPAGRRSFSESSVGSPEVAPAFLSQFKTSPSGPKRRRRRPMRINVEPTPELPDSTDFVCGTLDEDRPLEEAYASAIEKKRAAKHRFTPQDIDPTFPTSDPELDEDEEEDEAAAVDESDQHMFVHGSLDSIDGVGNRGRKTAPTPKRLRSPPPISRRGPAHRSPPPRRPVGTSPKRARSPAPFSRRPSLLQSPPTYKVSNLHFVGMAERPRITIPASLPRTPVTYPMSPILNEDDSPEGLPSRGAIDIKAGLEQKRQRRKEKLYQKHCRKQQKEGEKRPMPGKGAERMREIGLEIAAYTKGKRAASPAKDALMLSI